MNSEEVYLKKRKISHIIHIEIHQYPKSTHNFNADNTPIPRQTGRRGGKMLIFDPA
jgi:hypothetical protein